MEIYGIKEKNLSIILPCAVVWQIVVVSLSMIQEVDTVMFSEMFLCHVKRSVALSCQLKCFSVMSTEVFLCHVERSRDIRSINIIIPDK